MVKDDRRKTRAHRGVRWITKMEVWHTRAKKMIRRRDGKPFRFPIYC